VAAIHGDLAQNVRDRVMKQFRDGTVRLLIATDVVGRGIDVTGVSHIINYDVPEDCDDYVHRIGRTGRLSGEAGFAFTFITPEEGDQLTNIEIRINKLLPQYQFTDFEPVRSRPARPPASAVIPPSPPSSVVTSFAVEEDDWAIL
jgi:ATP-dependent RNA helicase DeaD